MHDPIKVWKELEIDGKKEHRVIDATVGRLIINDAIPQNLGFKKRETTDEMFPLEIDFVVGKKQLGRSSIIVSASTASPCRPNARQGQGSRL